MFWSFTMVFAALVGSGGYSRSEFLFSLRPEPYLLFGLALCGASRTRTSSHAATTISRERPLRPGGHRCRLCREPPPDDFRMVQPLNGAIEQLGGDVLLAPFVQRNDPFQIGDDQIDV